MGPASPRIAPTIPLQSVAAPEWMSNAADISVSSSAVELEVPVFDAGAEPGGKAHVSIVSLILHSLVHDHSSSLLRLINHVPCGRVTRRAGAPALAPITRDASTMALTQKDHPPRRAGGLPMHNDPTGPPPIASRRTSCHQTPRTSSA